MQGTSSHQPITTVSSVVLIIDIGGTTSSKAQERLNRSSTTSAIPNALAAPKSYLSIQGPAQPPTDSESEIRISRGSARI